MRDLYVVFEEDRAIKCVFHTIVVRNGALAEKYPGGLRAFTEKNLSRSNRDLTVYCDMGSDIGDVWCDLVNHGLTPDEDFIGFDATSHTMVMGMGGKDNAEEVIEFTVPWLEGRCTEEGAFVWLSEGAGSAVTVGERSNGAPSNASEEELDIDIYHHGPGDFQRLKRKKWNWEFLASGLVTWNMASTTDQTFYIGSTRDNRYWALQDHSYNRKIVAVAEVKNFQPHHVSEIALELLSAYDDNVDFLLRQMTEFGKIPLPIPGKN